MIELDPGKYMLLREPIKSIKINTLFARWVIEKNIQGKIYVDHPYTPKTFYVEHPYGMSLLFGDHTNEGFNEQFLDYCLNKNGKRSSFVWMQAAPNSWDKTLKKLFGDNLRKSDGTIEIPSEFIELDTRVNFQFDLQKFQEYKKGHTNEGFEIKRTDKESFKNMKGTVVPSYFWESAESFCEKGVGFSLFAQGKLASTAYSAFIFENELEIGIETMAEFRGNGFAQYVSAALIDYCLQHNYEPIWACKYTNTASYKTALKLGFVPKLTLPYYRLAI